MADHPQISSPTASGFVDFCRIEHCVGFGVSKRACSHTFAGRNFYCTRCALEKSRGVANRSRRRRARVGGVASEGVERVDKNAFASRNLYYTRCELEKTRGAASRSRRRRARVGCVAREVVERVDKNKWLVENAYFSKGDTGGRSFRYGGINCLAVANSRGF